MKNDIIKKIDVDFSDLERKEVMTILKKINTSNTGIEQVVRSILYLSNGNLEEVKKYYLMYRDDPRDVVMEAEKNAGNPGHWFTIPFDEMKDFSGDLPKNEDTKS